MIVTGVLMALSPGWLLPVIGPISPSIHSIGCQMTGTSSIPLDSIASHRITSHPIASPETSPPIKLFLAKPTLIFPSALGPSQERPTGIVFVVEEERADVRPGHVNRW
ncbi:hypothetical protein BO94DRAFT_590994 [Aspergillus sclerotioniger CBS 115572]|uniref:Uncharacterized protein n=1 Tax=Aspergillus sclerotioniger CBS 115572 TaxID=1450535 RepID=A0A317UZI0_9EURO|nr:hypothetical protein BO94DRAFT_590994 [Aspergillus sclerotioniger CBS 115572]PWY67086.1 hypothetical protein BO94DRAFT_590994 [Aspergillus sclerotioniger CBS 115572]